MTITDQTKAGTSPTQVETLTRIRLTDMSRDKLQSALVGLPDPSIDPDTAMARLHRAFACLPDAMLRDVMDVGRHPDTAGIGLVENLPVDPVLPPTPADGGPSTVKATFVSEGVLLGLSGLIGEPTGITTEKDGQLVHDVIPVATGARSQTNQSSATFLNFHNDIVYDESGTYTTTNPDFLVLLCVRPDHNAEAATLYADARDLLAALDTRTVALLRQPLFQLNAPGSYCRAVGQDQVLSELTPIITGPLDKPEISSSANGVMGVTPEADDAFTLLQKTARTVAHRVHLRPGQALLINNRKGIHARTQFQARHDGTDRWLQRSYVRRDMWSLRYRFKDQTRRVMS